MTILAAHVNKAEAERTLLKPPATWQAYDYYMRAADTFVSFQSSFNVPELYETRRLLEYSLSIDPMYARAYSVLALAYLITYFSSHSIKIILNVLPLNGGMSWPAGQYSSTPIFLKPMPVWDGHWYSIGNMPLP